MTEIVKEKNILIFDKINFLILISKINKNNNIFYIKETLLSKILNLFFKNKIQKINWDLIDIEKNDNKVITDIIENLEVSEFVYGYLNEVYENKEKDIDNNFYHYLVKTLSNEKKIIGFMSVENFLVLLKGTKIKFNNSNINFYLEENDFQNFIIKKFQERNFKFIFYKKYFRFEIFKRYLSTIKKFRYAFINKPKSFLNKKITVMDSFEINKPDNFFSDKAFREKILFITDNEKKNFNSVINIFRYIDLKIVLNFFTFLFKKNLYNDNKLLNFLFNNFLFEKNIYYKFFKENNIKIFFSCYLTQNFTSAAIAALHKCNGSSIGFTMSFTERFKSNLNIDAFNYFITFSNANFKKIKYSNLNKIVNLGYICDYKFEGVKSEASEIRKTLKENGAKYIIGFFDQGSSSDKMFNVSHKFSRTGYKFLLEKILNDKKYGLIIKPKKPKLLKEKLGSVYQILEKALETKRCIVFDKHDEKHVKNFIDIPAKVAMASDLTIHDTLLAGTAGLESALTGTKSIFFDYYKSKKNQFEKMGLNIVFRDWDLLWEQIQKDYNKENQTNFGDWSKIIQEFDKFRNGKTNIRIVEFMKNLNIN